MKILDTAMTEIVKGNSARYYSKYVVDGKEHAETLNNFKFQNIINPNNEITIGNTCASGVTFSIYMPAISLENKEITIFEGVKVGTEINYIKLGIFTVTKQTSDGEYTSYEAYDRMYKADMPYFSDMTFPSTDKDILNEICGKLGISLATNIVTAHTISDKPQGYTYREIIGYMAMLQGSNAVINADGNLELRWYKDSSYVLDGHKYYQQGVTFTTSKDFIIQKLTCNNTKSGSTEQSQITSGDGATGLSFANPFMTQAILDEVYKKIGGFTFRPLDLYIKKDPTTGELKSAIEAIADDITLNASGTINISGNKSVNINGNLFTLTSTNTTISADGSIDCKKLKAVAADLEGTFKNVNVTDGGITMTTTIIGGEYLIKSSTGAFLQIQGHYIEMSNDDGSGTNWILSRSECVFNDYLNVKLYHPSLKNYMRPALSMRNPVTFDWSGSVLTIYVDDVAVATWDSRNG